MVPSFVLDRLTRFDKTNEMLVHCNALAVSRIDRASRDLKHHVHELEELKKDVDSVFKRIRVIKNKLAMEHPEAFKGNNS
jgi:chromosome segregation ATPase